MKSFSFSSIPTQFSAFIAWLILASALVRAETRITSTGFSSIISQPSIGLWNFGTTGYTNQDQLPKGISTDFTWTSLAGGERFCIAVDGSGSLSGWGNIAISDSSSFRIGSDRDWKSVAAGGGLATALKIDGSLWAWGDGFPGETIPTQSAFPVRIGDGLNWKSIATGKYHRMAIRNDGSLWAWGYNSHGTLGDGTHTGRPAPVQIGTANDWAFVAAGVYTSFAIKTNGSLWIWGDVFGTGSNPAPSDIPIQLGTDSDWISVAPSTDANIAFAIKQDGSLWSWGENPQGVLGHGDNQPCNVPTKIGTDTDWKSVAPGATHVIATKSDASIWMWGALTESQLPQCPLPVDRSSLFDPSPKIRIFFTYNNEVNSGVGNLFLIPAILGEPTPNSLEIRNEGLLPLTLSSINLPPGFTADTLPLIVPPLGDAAYQIRLDPPSKGQYTGEIHLINDSSNVPDFQTEVTGWVVSPADDTDADGLNDAAEVALSALGFIWNSTQTDMVETLMSKAEFAGLIPSDGLYEIQMKAHAPVVNLATPCALLRFELFDPAVGTSLLLDTASSSGAGIKLDIQVPENCSDVRIRGN